MISGGKR
jgi:hypothetical protein